MNKCTVLRYRGHPCLNQGPLDLQSYSLTLSYIVMSIGANNTT